MMHNGLLHRTLMLTFWKIDRTKATMRQKRASFLKTLLRLKNLFMFTALAFLTMSSIVISAPYADVVMDARSGEILRTRNADTRLHPASLTKMMTLYIAFEAIENGEIDVDKKVVISRKAANERPSKLGLRTGQKISLRYLIRAAAIKSANDAATAIGEAISGSEAAFARRMNRTAKSLGMTRSTFKNAHGLTEKGHLSTARDMTILGRHLMYDYPGYYKIFKRKKTDASVQQVRNTNRKFLSAYSGADGIKTGYTHKAGFNLVASAKRENKRIIATVFGGKSTLTRNKQAAILLDLGFERAPLNSPLILPIRKRYLAVKEQKYNIPIEKSLRPFAKSSKSESDILLAMAKDIAKTVKISLSKNVINVSENFDENPSSKVKKNNDLIVVTRASEPRIKNWKIDLGKQNTRFQAEKLLLKAALHEISLLAGAKRFVVQGRGGFQARFTNLSKDNAEKICVKLKARNFPDCRALGPTS